MLRLEHDVRGGYAFLAGSHTFVGEDVECEVDCLLLSVGYDGEVELAVAECKGRDEVDDNDVATLADICERVRRTGVECFAIAATTRERFTEDEIERFRRFRDVGDDPEVQWRRSGLILFTERELGTFDPRLTQKIDRLPHLHPTDLREFSENSTFVYLDSGDEAAAVEEAERLI